MDTEMGSVNQESRLKFYKTTLCLAYQSLGVVYGDLSISPIYVYQTTFSGGMKLYENNHEILGVLSLVIWTLTIIPLFKYVIFVLGADDNGEGGTFALYSLLCRHSKMGLLNASYAARENISSCDSQIPTEETRTSLLLKEFFQKHRSSRIVLLLVVLLGTSMVIGDGILTPTMSVLSAVIGIKVQVKELHENHAVIIACVILVGLFALQHFGTHKVGFLFAPILIAWLLCISGIGIYNIIHWNPHVIRAISPHYIYNFFRETGKVGWSSLGAIVLCITGAEAMFADLGHFSKLSVRIAFTAIVYPCLILAYMGEAAYLSQNRTDVEHSFHKAIPSKIYELMFWPVFIIATLATVVGSQAIISATFSIISQCRALRCFPRVKIVHTSSQVHGQIYIPEVNWILMGLCIAVAIGFRDISMIGHAYGLAVITVMFVTTCLMFLIISTVWKQNIMAASMFIVIFGSVELLYFLACIAKVQRGGWLPILFSLVFMSLMSIWQYGTSKKHQFELENKVCLESLFSLGPSLGISRVPGIGLIYTNLESGVPPMFAHFVTNFPAFHRILIFVTLQSLMVPKVPPGERFLVSRIGSSEFYLYHCVVRYGYKDVRDSYDFETKLIEKVAAFLQSEELAVTEQPMEKAVATGNGAGVGSGKRRKVQFQCVELNEEVKELMEARESGVAYMIGNPSIIANEVSSPVKKFVINVVYGFLRRNCRLPAIALGIPHTSLVEVGMVYHV
ncbi:probable potassium transporter 13 isoform X1 [Vitis vinifera]|uniref:probable potassium transporter 13 isoform X1 n=2 Tax=Vitis vinifera TaxID=29760 RepID=UPI00053FDEE8|nr:probable potassium transporter 13 isoform X1 [Vitis vinifera]|eukprot:XP_010644860.1 PREDICTED: probable potassium transporter 13 isoform X1 [Vitis vinifera]